MRNGFAPLHFCAAVFGVIISHKNRSVQNCSWPIEISSRNLLKQTQKLSVAVKIPGGFRPCFHLSTLQCVCVLINRNINQENAHCSIVFNDLRKLFVMMVFMMGTYGK